MMYNSYLLNGLWGEAGSHDMTLAERRGDGQCSRQIMPGGLRMRRDGTYSFREIRISEGDIARIAQMYPLRNKPKEALKKEWVDPNII